MPIYSFASEDGKTLDEIVPLGTDHITRDGVRYGKVLADECFSVGNQVKIPSQAEQVKDGYHQLEQRHGSRFLRKSQFSTKQIKRAWGF
jgi:hypothetical protein